MHRRTIAERHRDVAAPPRGEPSGRGSPPPSGRALPARLATIISVVVIASMVLTPVSALAQRMPTDRIAGVPLAESGFESAAPDVIAPSALVVGPDDRVLWERDIDERRAVASITKVMTALIVLEQANLDDVVTISEAASRAPYATGLHPGERFTVRKLLELALVASSNDAAHALAEHVGGSVPAFASLMNARALQLGLEDTHFANPHGIDTEGHHSCADDVAELAEAAMDIPEFRRIVALQSVVLPKHEDRAEREIKSTDRLLGRYEGLAGIKTGFTGDARYCFVAAAERHGVELTAVVLGSPNSSARFDDTTRLLDWGFEHLGMRTVATTTETVGAAPISANPSHLVPIRFAETTSTLVFDLDGPITRSVSFDPTVALPVYAGQPLGQVELTQGERTLMTIPAVAARDVASAEETVGAVPVSDYLDRTVQARAGSDAVDVPVFNESAGVERTVELDEHVDAPVAEGDRLGTITYSQNGRTLVTVPVVAAEDVETPSAFARVGIWLARAWRGVLDQPIMAAPEVVSVPAAAQ